MHVQHFVRRVLVVGLFTLGNCAPPGDGGGGAGGGGQGGGGGRATGGSGGVAAAGGTGVMGTGGAAAGSGGGAGGVTSAGGSLGGPGTGGTTGLAGSGGTAAVVDGGVNPGDSADVAAPVAGAPRPRGKSAGCGKAAPAIDSSAKFTKHDIDVTGVDPVFIAAHPANVGGYTWTKRNYYVKLPANYDVNKGHEVHFGGGGCGNTNGMSGDNGGFAVPGTADPGAIQIGLSYVFDNGACFKDEFPNTPELQYFDSVVKELDANYCFDREKVFIAGYSSGAWEAYTLGLARGGVIRGIATAAGGLRKDRPMPSRQPIAALLLTGASDESNPITGATGSALARDLVLQTNGCAGTATSDWAGMPACKQYTGCPAAFPVIWCTPAGAHTDGGGDYKGIISKFWATLPPAP